MEQGGPPALLPHLEAIGLQATGIGDGLPAG